MKDVILELKITPFYKFYADDLVIIIQDDKLN